VHGLDPLEEPRCERDRVVLRGQLRLPFAVKGLNVRGAHVGAQHPEEPAYPVAHAAGALQRDNRVLEGRRLFAAGHSIDLGTLLGERTLEGTGEELRLRLVPGRHAAVRAGPGGEKRVRAGR
jgi:hypothetical protein